MSAANRHRLDGLEPENLLAFLALLGLLRALEAADQSRTGREKLCPRVGWNIDTGPVRPVLYTRAPIKEQDLASLVWEGISGLSKAYKFDDRAKLKFNVDETRTILANSVVAASSNDRMHTDIWGALVTDARPGELAAKTPLCLLDVAQTSFLKSLSRACDSAYVPGRGDKNLLFKESIRKTLFAPWDRTDSSLSFRWDPAEDSRHAYRWKAPTEDRQGVQHGANALAAIAVSKLALAPILSGKSIRPTLIGGYWQKATGNDTGFSFAWPIWHEPAKLSAIVAILGHPYLRKPDRLAHLGVEHVMVARRIREGRYMAFSRARPISEQSFSTGLAVDSSG